MCLDEITGRGLPSCPRRTSPAERLPSPGHPPSARRPATADGRHPRRGPSARVVRGTQTGAQPYACLMLPSRRDQAPRARRRRCHARDGVRLRRARRGLPGLAPRGRPRRADSRRGGIRLSLVGPGGIGVERWGASRLPTRRARSRSRRPRTSSDLGDLHGGAAGRGALSDRGSKRTSSRAAWPSWRPAPSRRSCGRPSPTR